MQKNLAKIANSWLTGPPKFSTTGWSISILHILTGWYDKNNACMKKIVVDLFSVHPEISFHNKKSEKNNIHFIS